MENVFCLQLSFSVHECSNYEKTDHLFDQFIRCTYDAAQYCRIYIYICECVYFIQPLNNFEYFHFNICCVCETFRNILAMNILCWMVGVRFLIPSFDFYSVKCSFFTLFLMWSTIASAVCCTDVVCTFWQFLVENQKKKIGRRYLLDIFLTILHYAYFLSFRNDHQHSFYFLTFFSSFICLFVYFMYLLEFVIWSTDVMWCVCCLFALAIGICLCYC